MTQVNRILLHEFMREIRTAIAEGSQVVLHKDGSVERIRYEAMNDFDKGQFLNTCVDFTDFVNRGMDPEVGDCILDNVIAGKPEELWLAGIEDATLGTAKTVTTYARTFGRRSVGGSDQGAITPTSNDARAERIERILSSYPDDSHTNFIDLLADAMHWCNRSGLDFADVCRIAGMHFAAEQDEAT